MLNITANLRHGLLPTSSQFEFHHFPISHRPLFQRLLRPHTFVSLPSRVCSNLEQLNIDPNQVRVKLNPHALTIVDKPHQKVYRLALTTYGKESIHANYRFLSSSNLSLHPQAISIIENDNIVISSETFQQGKPVNVLHDSSRVVTDIFSTLQSFYHPSKTAFDLKKELDLSSANSTYLSTRQNMITANIKELILKKFPQSSSLVTSPIHGDLTQDNILHHLSAYFFIDFDQTRTGFIEEDAFLLEIYAHTKTNNFYNSLTLVETASSLLTQNKLPKFTQLANQQYPLIKHNISSIQLIKAVFFYHLMGNIFLDVSNDLLNIQIGSCIEHGINRL
jgi:hypothetical protein